MERAGGGRDEYGQDGQGKDCRHVPARSDAPADGLAEQGLNAGLAVGCWISHRTAVPSRISSSARMPGTPLPSSVMDRISAANASRAGALLTLVESTAKPRRLAAAMPRLPERGLADARPTDQHQRLGAVPNFQELVQQDKLRLSPDRLGADASDGCQR